jgi:HKD family nuclease
MVEKNRIDLLKEIGSIKKCELIILTTFSFDPLFFDHMVLKELRKGNPYAKIVVLADSNHVDVESRTDLTGLDYRMITIPSTFHPKMFIFCGPDETISFIGSHNITLAGFSHNLELTCKIKDQDLSLQCLDCIRSVLLKFLANEDPLLTDIKRQMSGKTYLKKYGEIHFIHNMESNILDQVISLIKESNLDVKEVKIISPFYSQVRSLAKKIRLKIHPSTIYLCVQKNNHTLDPKQIENLHYVSTLEVRTKKHRRIHSKIILFKGSKNELALIGSPNFTGAALNETYQIGKGNFEVALLIKGKGISELFAELDFTEISLEEIEESRIKELQIRPVGYPYNIVSASYDIFGSLQIDFFGSSNLTKGQVNLQPLNKNTVIRYPVDLEPGKRQIFLQVKQKIKPGTMIWLSSQKREQISNKTCINVLESMRGSLSISRTKSIGRILKVLASSKSLEDLLRLILSLCPSEDFSSDSVLSQAVVSKGNRQRMSVLPSRIKTRVKTETDVIEVLENLFRLSRTRKYQIDSRRTLSSISHVDKQKIEDRVKKLPSKFAKFFELSRLVIANDPDTYTLYILLSMKLCEIISKTFRLEELQELLLAKSMSNFTRLYKSYGISEGDCSKLLSLLIFVQTQSSCHVRKEVVEQIADKSSLNPSDLLDLDSLSKMGLSVIDKEAYLNFAENIILSTLKKRIDLWKYFMPESSMVKSLSEYYLSLVPDCQDIPPNVFRDAIAGDELGITVLYEKGYYPLIGNDGLPILTIQVPPDQVLQKTFEILRPGFKIFDEQKSLYVYLKRLLLDEIERLLSLISSEVGCRFVPGRILRKIKRTVS